jgi:hypothetical protein
MWNITAMQMTCYMIHPALLGVGHVTQRSSSLHGWQTSASICDCQLA